MKFQRSIAPNASFELPDDPTFKQKLAFDGEYTFARGPRVFKAWAAMLTVVSNWECEILPDPTLNLDLMNDEPDPDKRRGVEQVIIWAASEALIFMASVNEIPKV